MFGYYENFFFGGNRKYNSTKNAVIQKNWTSKNTFYKLLDMLISRFKWELPDSCDSRFLEFILLINGYAAFANIKKEIPKIGTVDGIMNLQVSTNEMFSPYGYPTRVGLQDYVGNYYGQYNIYSPQVNIENSAVLCLESNYNIAPISRIIWYANRLTDIETSINAAILNLRSSTIIQCTKEQVKSIERAFQQAYDGKPVIISSDDNTINSPDPKILFSSQTSDILTTLYEAKQKTMSEFCAEFGINSNEIVNKLSGVSDFELEQNEEYISLMLNSELESRKRCCEELKEYFGIDASVELSFKNKNEDSYYDEDNDGGDDDDV